MHLAFNLETPLLGIPKESIRDVYENICPEMILVQLLIIRKLTEISNNSGSVKQMVVRLYYVTGHVIQEW